MEGFSSGEFLQGFLEEAGEHLQSINQNLLQIEAIQEQTSAGGDHLPGVDAQVELAQLVNELFRSFHTLKGLAGMVGLQEGAALAHRMEAVLHQVRGGSTHCSPEMIDVLLAGTRAFSEVVAALRSPLDGKPSVEHEIVALDRFLGETAPSPAAGGQAALESAPPERLPAVDLLPGLASYPELIRGLSEVEEGKIQRAARSGRYFAVVAFTSSTDRAARGENIDRMRQQLADAGVVVKAAPLLHNGQMQFLFLVHAEAPLDPAGLIADEVVPLTVHLLPDSLPAQAAGAANLNDRADRRRSSVVRVELDRLDELMRAAGELTLQQARLDALLDQIDTLPTGQRRAIENNQQHTNRVLRNLRRAVLRARMVPLAETFNRMPLVARDIARAMQKEIRLVVEGEQTEVDKQVVERLMDPLIHLVRNAVSHGIELPAERRAAGKPAQGTLNLRARQEGETILVEVVDDGRGVDLDQVAARAAALGLRSEDDPFELDDALAAMVAPGFTTRGEADLGAGRGVGLDVVNRAVRALGGRLTMQTEAGKWTAFRLHLPLTLLIMDVILTRVGGDLYALPRDSIERVLAIEPERVTHAERRELFQEEDDYLVLHRLGRVLGRPEPAEPARMFALVAYEEEVAGTAAGAAARSRHALVVDHIIDMREVVVHTLADPLVSRQEVDGATELGDSSVALILNVPNILRLAKKG